MGFCIITLPLLSAVNYFRRILKSWNIFISTGIDSSSTACIVASMCYLICEAVQNGNAQVLSDVRTLVHDAAYVPVDPKELCGRLFVTCYMGTENSSTETRDRASNLAKDIGSYHLGLYTFAPTLFFCSTFNILKFFYSKSK